MAQDDRNSREGTEEIYQRSTQTVRETPSRHDREHRGPTAPFTTTAASAKRKRNIFEPQPDARRISPISSSLRGLSDPHDPSSDVNKRTTTNTRQYESSPIKPVFRATRHAPKRRRLRASEDTSSIEESDAFDSPKKPPRPARPSREAPQVEDDSGSGASEGEDIEFKPSSVRASSVELGGSGEDRTRKVPTEKNRTNDDQDGGHHNGDGDDDKTEKEAEEAPSDEEYASADDFHDAPAQPADDKTTPAPAHENQTSEQPPEPPVARASPEGERPPRPSAEAAPEGSEDTVSERGTTPGSGADIKPAAAPRRRRKWSDEETDALKDYIVRYGPRWARIKLADNCSPRPILTQRDQGNLKDKARQLVVEYYRCV